MGNKNLASENATQSKFFVFRKKNSFENSMVSKIFSQSIYCGKTIEIEPEISLLEKKCLNCKSKNFDDGLETPVECVICKNIYIAKDHEIINIKKNEISTSKLTLSIVKKPHYKEKLIFKELSKVVLFCNRDQLPQELINDDDEIDYKTILDKIILPFFTIKSRIVFAGSIFKIGNFEFKIGSCDPLIGGRITKKTNIYCYNTYQPSNELLRIRVGNKKLGNVNKKEVMELLGKIKNHTHLNIDQSFYLNDYELTIIHSWPTDGCLTKDTVIEFQEEKLKEIKNLTLLCPKDAIDKILRIINNINIEDLKKIIKIYYIEPFFQGISRYIEKSSNININETSNFLIYECNPHFGLVTSNTKITIMINEDEFLNSVNYLKFEKEEQRKNEEEAEAEAEAERVNTSSEEHKNVEQEIDENENEDENEDYEEEKKDNLMRTSTVGRTVGNRSTSLNFSFARSNNPNENERHFSFNNPFQERRSENNMNNYDNRNQENEISEIQEETLNDQLESDINHIRLPIRVPSLRVRAFENSLNHDELNQAINRVLNAFLLFNDPLMQSFLGERRSYQSNGASKFQISRLPERKITKKFILEKRDSEENLTKCMICLNEYEDQEDVRTMPCLHYFHKECLDIWLSKSKTCPMCKTACDINEKELLHLE